MEIAEYPKIYVAESKIARGALSANISEAGGRKTVPGNQDIGKVQAGADDEENKLKIELSKTETER